MTSRWSKESLKRCFKTLRRLFWFCMLEFNHFIYVMSLESVLVIMEAVLKPVCRMPFYNPNVYTFFDDILNENSMYSVYNSPFSTHPKYRQKYEVSTNAHRHRVHPHIISTVPELKLIERFRVVFWMKYIKIVIVSSVSDANFKFPLHFIYCPSN